MGRPENVLGTSQINLPGMFLERQLRASPGRHFRAPLRRQIVTSRGRSNRIFRRRHGDVGGWRPREGLGTNICWLGSNLPKNSKFFNEFNKNIIGKMKDVSEGKIIHEFFWLKSKMHSMKNINGKKN